MKENRLSFESEGLVVDYISFNIKGFVDKTELERIANYLFQNFGFNSTFVVRLAETRETLFHSPKNKYHIYFTVYTYSDIYWNGIKIDFSGNNGNQLYNLIVANEINWEKFNHEKKLQLSRIDLCYVHNKTNNNTSVESFLKKCYEKVAENNAIKNFSLQKNSSSFILKIGKRGSPNFYRVYEKNTETRFELEQRGTKIKALQKLIFNGHLKEFEQIMVENFFKYSKKVLVIDENHTDWLIDYLRRKNKPKESLSLITGYFSQNIDNLMNTDDKKKFFRFLQFITFSHSQTTYTKTFWNQSYSIVQFKITDFMDFIQIHNKNQYQREKLIQFLEELQVMKPFVKIYTSESFQSFTIFPAVKIRKEFGEYGPWIAKVAILKELHFYSYRFFFPTYFLICQNDLELQVKLHFIQIYSSQNLNKTFYSNQILEKYKHANNQKKSQLKQLIQHVFQQALKYKIIQKNCQIEFKNKKIQLIQVQELTPLCIGQIETINFYERIF